MTRELTIDMTSPSRTGAVSAEQRWTHLNDGRTAMLDRKRFYASLTVPSLLPEDGIGEGEEQVRNYQSLGARGVNNLAAKLLLALFPPGMAFFRYDPDEGTVGELEAAEKQSPPQDGIGVRDKLNAVFAERERIILRHFNTVGLRPALYQALRSAIAIGDGAIAFPGTERARWLRLDRYVVQRDGNGTLSEFVIRDTYAPGTLPAELRKLIPPADDGTKLDDTPQYMYTWGVRNGSRWTVTQEFHGQPVGSPSEYPLDLLPFIFIRWNGLDGEHYGRSLIEDLVGDLHPLDELQADICQAAAAGSKVIWLVKPGSSTNLNHLKKAKSGDFVHGSVEDVQALRVDKQADLAVASQQCESIKGELQKSFLMVTSIQRSGERVTAQEIRELSRELDTALGGVYSSFTETLQRPLALTIEAALIRGGKLAAIGEKSSVTITMLTGLDALGRSAELTKLNEFAQFVAALPEGPKYLKTAGWVARAADSFGLQAKGLVRDDAEVSKQNQQAAMMQAMQTLMGNGQLMTQIAQQGSPSAPAE